ncbi:MAG: HD domain-containing protein [Alphaproteobacteria bacterium]|nr:HD domain-containing protein [Alphaproteobacteria bacterium]
MTSLEDLFRCLTDQGSRPYDGDFEAVTQLAHALQSAMLAQSAQAGPAMIAAALFHDIGHLVRPEAREELLAGTDDRHEGVGAAILEPILGPAVSEPVRLHVAAKRYLVTTRPGYADRLSDGSRMTLRLQGGAMSTAEAERFASHPYAQDAIALRYWDDAAKLVGQDTPPLDHFRAVLAPLAG